nr:hypothetical protein Iba_chr03bCG8240 [Ipomoea batatas]
MPPVTGIAQAADFTIGYSSNHRRAKEGEANITANFTIGHHSNNLRDHHSPQQLLPMSQPPTINGGQTQPMSPPPMGPSTAAPLPPRLPLLPEPSLAPVSFSLKNGGTGEENNETVVMAWVINATGHGEQCRDCLSSVPQVKTWQEQEIGNSFSPLSLRLHNSNDDVGDVRSSPLLIMLSPTTARAKR